ncbi:hypothetical protein SUGI_0301620 [Cryptomeria japonica]|nr:hypothetical protein SUGI_0301620 [Cryptomeria japonica]
MKNNRSGGVEIEQGSSQPKPKRSRNSIRRDTPPKRSSIYRGVTRHRWTGRYEAHLWDKYCWNQAQSKKGRQVYLGAYDDEETAAHAYDLAALKYWGQETVLNFPIGTYTKEIEEMKNISKEEYVSTLRRKSSGFSRGVSKYRGVARHHHNGRWEARIGRVFGNKYLYLGTYGTQEEAATAYDMAAIEYRGLNAVTNFDLSRYIKWLRPANGAQVGSTVVEKELNLLPLITKNKEPNQNEQQDNNNKRDTINTTLSRGVGGTPPAHEMTMEQPQQRSNGSTSTALGLLLQSSKFKEMLERSTTVEACADSESELNRETMTTSYSEDMESLFEGSEYMLNQSHEEYNMIGSSNNLMMNMLQHAVSAPNSSAYDQLQLQTICTNNELMDHESLIDLLNSTGNNSSGQFIPFGSHLGSSSS